MPADIGLCLSQEFRASCIRVYSRKNTPLGYALCSLTDLLDRNSQTTSSIDRVASLARTAPGSLTALLCVCLARPVKVSDIETFVVIAGCQTVRITKTRNGDVTLERASVDVVDFHLAAAADNEHVIAE